MAVRAVVRLPDPVLTTPTVEVETIDDSARELGRDLVDTMRASPACVGLAANQIGDRRRAFAVDVTGHRKASVSHGEIVMFNPVVVEAHAPVLAREGCMSVPDLTGDVLRAQRVVVHGLGLDGGELIIESDGFEARALLHEIDHLDGLVFLDRVESHAAVFRRRVYR